MLLNLWSWRTQQRFIQTEWIILKRSKYALHICTYANAKERPQLWLPLKIPFNSLDWHKQKKINAKEKTFVIAFTSFFHPSLVGFNCYRGTEWKTLPVPLHPGLSLGLRDQLDNCRLSLHAKGLGGLFFLQLLLSPQQFHACLVCECQNWPWHCQSSLLRPMFWTDEQQWQSASWLWVEDEVENDNIMSSD